MTNLQSSGNFLTMSSIAEHERQAREDKEKLAKAEKMQKDFMNDHAR
jgi:hypothetical protein